MWKGLLCMLFWLEWAKMSAVKNVFFRRRHSGYCARWFTHTLRRLNRMESLMCFSYYKSKCLLSKKKGLLSWLFWSFCKIIVPPFCRTLHCNWVLCVFVMRETAHLGTEVWEEPPPASSGRTGESAWPLNSAETPSCRLSIIRRAHTDI